MTWQDDFAPDGSLRDVVVARTTREDWSAVLSLVESRYRPLRFVDGQDVSDSIRTDRLFVAGETRPVLLFNVGVVELACHFFDQNEIEFDFYPNNIMTEDDLAPLLQFLAEVGEATGKAATITPENVHDAPIFRFSPSSGVVHYVAV